LLKVRFRNPTPTHRRCKTRNPKRPFGAYAPPSNQRWARGGNVSDVLLKFQQLANQFNTKELPCYFPLYTIRKSVFQAYNALQIT